MLWMPFLGLPASVQVLSQRVERTGFLIAIFWACERAIDVTQRLVAESAWAQERPASRALLPLSARIGKVVLAGIALVALLAELGYSVTTLLAGLGIGGLAVALAAQKTVENLFGALSLGADQPFREGDFVRVEDVVGTVEAIGLRSTRIRTLDRTLVSIPNGKLAEMRLETFAARDRIRLACTLGLVYGTSVSQMRDVLAELEKALREHPKIWPESVVVRFKEFGSSSLDIEIMAWFVTRDFAEFQLIRQEMLLRFMEVVEAQGSAFAFPTRTLHVQAVNGGPAA
jgi:MscS family membrane protein